MKKITFFIAVMLSLNAGIVVRKDDEDNNIQAVKHCSAKNKKGTALWLQHFVKQLKTGFYLINKTGVYQKIIIKKIKKETLYHRYKKLSDNCLRYDFLELNQ
ncbi:MAG: hypothetical protein L3J74_16380 [Bacteroidales bacterium]|nr:hypothetical protein [Bacteroidales bacterium]